MNADTQIQRRQLHFLGSQLYAGDRCLHFQRREACVDRVPAIGLGYAANRPNWMYCLSLPPLTRFRTMLSGT
jgi:hypothetical protein